jgi:hypothetical protein
VMAGLVSSGTTGGGPRFAPGVASITSELAGKVTAIGWVGSKLPSVLIRPKHWLAQLLALNASGSRATARNEALIRRIAAGAMRSWTMRVMHMNGERKMTKSHCLR